MRRRVLLLLSVIALLGLAATARAQAAPWPAFPLDDEGFRGEGYYLSGLKVVCSWLLFFAWVVTTSWVNRDAQELKGPYLRFNALNFAPFFAAFLLLWIVPSALLGFLLLLVAYLAPLGIYVAWRDARVLPHLRVVSGDFWMEKLAAVLEPLGIKLRLTPRSEEEERGPLARLFPRGGADEDENGRRLLAARESPGYRAARELVGLAMRRQTSSLIFDFSAEGVAVRHLVDGVWSEAEALSREEGDAILDTLRKLSGFEAAARRPAAFRAELDEVSYNGTLAVPPASSGSRVIVQFDQQTIRFKTLDELGLRPKAQEYLLNESLAAPKGLFLFAALPAAGLRTTTGVVLAQLDRFTREFVALEDAGSRYETVENIPVTVYDPQAGVPRHQVLTTLFRKEPDVVVVRDLGDAASVRVLCQQVQRANRLVLSTVRAKDSIEALLRVLALKVPPAEFAPAITGVLYQRLVRLLCDECKTPYTPSPDLLKRMNIPAGRVGEFFQPPTGQRRACRKCGGIGYRGRTGIFELLVVDDGVRRVLQTAPGLDALRQAARNAGLRTLQEEGLALMVKGATSLQELSRALG